MIVIAFVALILTVIMQQVFLQRAQVREELYRAIAEHQRADAELQLQKARAALALEKANQLLKENAPK
jgi:hypothetical protein